MKIDDNPADALTKPLSKGCKRYKFCQMILHHSLLFGIGWTYMYEMLSAYIEPCLFFLFFLMKVLIFLNIFWYTARRVVKLYFKGLTMLTRSIQLWLEWSG